MHAPRSTTVTTTQDADRTYAALTELASAPPYTEVARDDASRTVGFTSGKTAFSWGHEYVATVTSTDAGASVEITAGGFDDKPKALLDGRKNVKAAGRVAQALQDALGS
ncbi:hypothetical protein [Aeromicrobium sp.]|uniref:hypothetical protein n=1 Tax=Aeromicrobium sp. TaxID=1871063 RepID=UPI003515D0E7